MCNGSTYRHLEADTDTHTTHRSYQNKNDIKNIEPHSLVSNIEPARSSLTEEKKKTNNVFVPTPINLCNQWHGFSPLKERWK